MSRGVSRIIVAVVSLALLAACTGSQQPPDLPPPAPPPLEDTADRASGREVELVLPPRDRLDPAVLLGLTTRLEALALDLPDGLEHLVVREPEAAVHVADLLELAAAREVRLVCALGEDALPAADRVAERHRRSTLCALPADLPEGPAGEPVPSTPAVRIDLPVAELGLLVGVAAATAAAEVAATADPEMTPVVGLVLGGDELPAAAFRRGLLEGLAGIEVVEVEEPDATPTEAVEAVLAAGATVVVFDGAHGNADALEVAAERGAAVLCPVDLLDEDHDAEVVLTYRMRTEQAVATVLASLQAGTLTSVPVMLGIGDGVVEVAVPSGWPAVRRELDRASDALVARDDPRSPLPDQASPDTGA